MTTFATPISRADASAEIRRLKRIADTGFTFAELKAEEAVGVAVARPAPDHVVD